MTSHTIQGPLSAALVDARRIEHLQAFRTMISIVGLVDARDWLWAEDFGLEWALQDMLNVESTTPSGTAIFWSSLEQWTRASKLLEERLLQ